MFETLKRLWNEGKLTEAMLDAAIGKSWILEGQKEVIISSNIANNSSA